MSQVQLFPQDKIVGVFRGFREGGMEFHADLVMPYQSELQHIPMHGQFMLVQLETPDEAVLGRVASLSSDGKLSLGAGEEFSIRAVKEHRSIPDDLREDYLRYRVNIRVLGVLRNDTKGKLTFVASHRRLPHVGSPVAFPSEEVLRFVARHDADGAPIGHLAMGEYIYAEGSDNLKRESWMQIKSPEVQVRFPVEDLVSRRSFIFARAGYGKSNLNKLLFSKLYESTPTVRKRGDQQVPVGTVIFDPDGEYFWPDDKGRPGLCDVPHLRDKLVVFTPRQAPSPFYGSFVASGIKLDLRRFKPSDVIGIAVPPERQSQQNVRKLRALDKQSWERLVDLIAEQGNSASTREISGLLRLDPGQEVEATAARSNMTSVVRSLHDNRSMTMDALLQSLRRGKLCVIDISQMRGEHGRQLAGLMLRHIFSNNQEQFTTAAPKTVPTIAVIEEAQSVLSETATAAEPYIEWVKEGRKYDLGAALVTQQPGSISTEILSQGDNWFVFHLLSAHDLTNLQRANAHFSEDVLSVLLNEPIPGQGVYWSSVAGMSYPVPLRVLSFEAMYRQIDERYTKAEINTFAQRLKRHVSKSATSPSPNGVPVGSALSNGKTSPEAEQQPVDQYTEARNSAIAAFRQNKHLMFQLQTRDGVPWGDLNVFFYKHLPSIFEDRDRIAYRLVADACNQIFGEQGKGWDTQKNSDGKTCVRALNGVHEGKQP